MFLHSGAGDNYILLSLPTLAQGITILSMFLHSGAE